MKGFWFTSEHGRFIGQIVQWRENGMWNIYIYNSTPVGGLHVAVGGAYSEAFPYENLYAPPVYERYEIITQDMAIETMYDMLEEFENENR